MLSIFKNKSDAIFIADCMFVNISRDLFIACRYGWRWEQPQSGVHQAPYLRGGQ